MTIVMCYEAITPSAGIIISVCGGLPLSVKNLKGASGWKTVNMEKGPFFREIRENIVKLGIFFKEERQTWKNLGN